MNKCFTGVPTRHSRDKPLEETRGRAGQQVAQGWGWRGRDPVHPPPPPPDRVCVTTLFSRLQTHLLPDGRVRDARAGGEVGKPTPSMNSRSQGVKVPTESPGEVLSSLWRRECVIVH